MDQTMTTIQESPLFDDAISKLRPGIFSHAVWIRFGNKEEPVPPKTIKAIFNEIENIRQYNPGDACQMLLLCAVFQHYSGQTTNALKTIQEAKSLAERTGIDQGIHWALWGACAICVQQGNFQQAALHLTSLQHSLNDRQDWILAGFVDVVRQSLLQAAEPEREKRGLISDDHSSETLLARTFQWLNQWGFSAHAAGGNASALRINGGDSRPPSSREGWQGRWRTLKLLFRGELKVDWLDKPEKQRIPRTNLWGVILSLLHIEVTSTANEAEIMEAETRSPASLVLPQSEDRPAAIITTSDVEQNTIEDEPRDMEPAEKAIPFIPISVHMLGTFSVTIHETILRLPSSRGLSLFKYLLLHHKQNIPREVLMDVFWPDAGPETARNNLNVAIHNLRRALRSVIFMPVIVFENGAYGFEPNVHIWLDIEEFERRVQAGRRLEDRDQRTSAMAEYEAAISLYQGDFLEQNPYDEWAVLDRERLRFAYLDTLARQSQIYFSTERFAMCISICKLILLRDRCREDAHCLLMHCYHHQGQDHLAFRQYQVCVEALRLELDVTPAPETTRLYEQIRLQRRG